MKNLNDDEICAILFNKGFTVLETSRLIKLRQDYTTGKFDQDALVQASYAPQLEKTSTIKKVFAALRFYGR
jgi:hypothetical protein